MSNRQSSRIWRQLQFTSESVVLQLLAGKELSGSGKFGWMCQTMTLINFLMFKFFVFGNSPPLRPSSGSIFPSSGERFSLSW